jgi:sulfur relay (sulfurtransferase) complex TusBCD TusD component (DsrE family)
MPHNPSLTDTLIMITRQGMGSADEFLQKRLLNIYLTILLEENILPGAICFYTDGVKLVVEGSPLLDTFKQIEQKGVRLLVCATCLNHFGLTEKVNVGIVGGMTDIVEAQLRANRVITL